MTIQYISAQDFKAVHSDNKGALLLDVRSEAEFTNCHVKGAVLHPLPDLDVMKVLNQFETAPADEPIYILCKAGGRAKKAADILAPISRRALFVVEGGTDACAECGIDVERAVRSSFSIERQVRLVVGLLIILGFVLGLQLDDSYHWLSAVMGGALFLTAIFGFCPVGAILSFMPWNKGLRDGA